MLHKTLEKICLIIIQWESYLILFLPLLVYRQTLYPYIFSKMIVFRILVEIISAAWLFLTIYNRNYRPMWHNPLITTSVIFMGFSSLTTLTSIDIGRSFWSSQERMAGLLTMLHFWLWFIILSSTFRYWKDWKKLIWISLICSLLVGLYGLGQNVGLQFLPKENNIRMSATLGNPIFLAIYSMLHVFLAGALILWERKRVWQFMAGVLLIFNLIIMFLTVSRGVTVVFSLTIFLFLIFVVFTSSSKRKKNIIISILVLSIIFILIGFFFLRPPPRGTSPFQTTTSDC